MADWLAYGLEDAFAEQPEVGIIRKTKSTSGLIKYQPKGDPDDWAAAAKAILATEKPDIIVVMLGLNDRIAIRQSGLRKGDQAPDNNVHVKRDTKPEPQHDAAKKPETDTELPQEEAENTDPVKTPRSPDGVYEFHEDHWTELYARKIDKMIAAVKAKGVPVIWVGLPAIRGANGPKDMLFLNSLYREAASKAGITYVDIWDGFVDERGLFMQKGPDFEGQTRQLRSYDGVYFTKYGARKLAHYVEREITRLLPERSAPGELPGAPEAEAIPGQTPSRPLAGPVMPLTTPSIQTDKLLGGPESRPSPVDALAARTLVKGEPLSPPPGRADDFTWPRREVGSEPAQNERPVASKESSLKNVRAQIPGPPAIKKDRR